MRLRAVKAHNFLALRDLEVRLDRPLTVLTGANGVGKSSVFEAVRIARDALAPDAHIELPAEWNGAIHHGESAMEVRVAILFDEPAEQALLDAFVHAAWLRLLHFDDPDVDRLDLAKALTDRLGEHPASMLYDGELVIQHDVHQRQQWVAGWEFETPAGRASARLVGLGGSDISGSPVEVDVDHAREVARRSELAVSGEDVVDRVRDGTVALGLSDVLSGSTFPFTVKRSQRESDPDSVDQVLAAVGRRWDDLHGDTRFVDLLRLLVVPRLTVTTNHRAVHRTHHKVTELSGPLDLSDGSDVPAELFRLKNGDAADRAVFRRAQAHFSELTGRQLEIVITPNAGEPGEGSELVPVVVDRGYEVPVRRAGSGMVEALYLATVLADERRIVFLDEPGVHLSPAGQRRLTGSLRRLANQQAVLITHNPELVPVEDPTDVSCLARLVPQHGAVQIRQLSATDVEKRPALLRQLSSPELRSVLFAEGVVLVEGPGDRTLVSRWASKLAEQRDWQDDFNHVVVSVDGQNNFASAIETMEALAIPWAAVTDGPALDPSRSKLSASLRRLGYEGVPARGGSLREIREAWSAVGVFTLAEEFGTDGSRVGEIEAYLTRVDPGAWSDANRAAGTSKSVGVFSRFAEAVEPDDRFVTVWTDVLAVLRERATGQASRPSPG